MSTLPIRAEDSATLHAKRCIPAAICAVLLGCASTPPAPSSLAAALTNIARFEQGPAYHERIVERAARRARQSADWPMFRHDPARSDAQPGPMPQRLAMMWDRALPARSTAAVIAGERAFCALPDAHKVVALGLAKTAQPWEFTAGGVVDSPPTCRAGRLVFGCCDGSVYCLRASDGCLIWRFLAAPDARRVSVRGQSESVWPLHGSLIVDDSNIVYAAAGRNSAEGIWLYALALATGDVLWQTSSVSTAAVEPFENSIMTSDGRHLLIGDRCFQAADGAPVTNPAARAALLYAGRAGMLENLAGSLTGAQDNVEHLLWRYGSECGARLAFDQARTCGFLSMPRALAERIVPWFSAGGPPQPHVNALFCADASGRRWVHSVPRYAVMKDMLMAGGNIYLAVQWAERMGRLCVYTAATGAQIQWLPLGAVPACNGLSAANGVLYIATEDGRLIKLAAPPEHDL